MNTKIYRLFFLVFLSLMMISTQIFSEDTKKDSKLNKIKGSPSRTYLNINNISTQIYNNGNSDIDPSGNSGLIFPKGSGKGAVYESGLLWGAKIDGDPQVRVGGSAYRQGLQPGKILSGGIPESPELPKNRIYRVRPDVFPNGPNVDLTSDAVDEKSSVSAIRAQYELDWLEWPAADGAPYDDVDGNGTYNPDTDIPGVPGADQTIWFVANDLDAGLTTNLYGANPLGIEMQATFWAYSQTGALGNMFFRKYKLINKSSTNFKDMYISMWSDVDLGNSSDDFAGCDTVLSLGYCYNAIANDPTYNPLPPPAVGFDFFQGPILNGIAGQDRNKNGIDDAEDYGIFGGKVVGPGKINLPMTSFYYFARGDASVVDPTQGDAQGSTQFYNFFQGKIGLTGAPFVDPNTNQPTTFALSGDPQTRTGWIDGQLLPGGDRRIGSASGPFVMAVGDTQEVVVAEIAAGAIPGVDRLSAIGLLKFYDKQAQQAYDNFFDLPVPPSAPEVNVVELDKQIILDWGENQNKVRATESNDAKGFTFQGYNVYQLPSPSADKSLAKRIATYDINDGIIKIKDDVFDAATGEVINVPVQFGNDTGIKRFLSIKNDELKGGTPLINGVKYYFAVTSYSYSPNPLAKPNNLENPLSVFTVVPHSKNPGVVSNNFADTLFTNHNLTPAEGASDGNVFPIVIDPSKLTGLDYKVTFEKLGDNVVWHLDRSDGVRVLANQSNQNADDESPIIDGLQIRVQGAPLDVKAIDLLSNAAGPITGGLASYEMTIAPIDVTGAISADWYRDVLLSPHGGALGIDDPMQVAGGYYFVVAGGSTIADHTAAIGRWSRDGDSWPKLIPNNYEIRFTERGGKGWMAYTSGALVDVPFELWYLGSTLDDTSDDIRMMPWIYDDNENDIFDFKLDHEASGADNDPYSDWIYFMLPEENAAPGETAYEAAVIRSSDPAYSGDIEIEHLARVVLMNWNQNQGDGGITELPELGTTFRIRMTIPNAAGVDEFTFSAPSAKLDNNLAKEEVYKINVFPNPYYAVNTEEINKYNRFVTFTHLPQKAKIRIFNLAGVLVQTIDKDNNDQFMRWNLANDSGLPVSSGIYLAYIDMPDLGKTKILKLAIIQEQQILDRF